MGIGVDILLSLITLVVAIVGTVLKDPSKRVKIFLISLAAATTIGTVIKAIGDESDKNFFKRALISTLSPSNGQYKNLEGDVAIHFAKLGYDHWGCYHTQGGMGCYLWSETNKDKHWTLILNSEEIGKMYAKEIAGEKDDDVIQAVCSNPMKPSEFDEDFKDRASILSSVVFWTTFGKWINFDYDDNVGIKAEYRQNGQDREISFAPAELTSTPDGDSCTVFYNVEQRIREKYKWQITLPVVSGQ
jgi:hypothetical protein